MALVSFKKIPFSFDFRGEMFSFNAFFHCHLKTLNPITLYIQAFIMHL